MKYGVIIVWKLLSWILSRLLNVIKVLLSVAGAGHIIEQDRRTGGDEDRLYLWTRTFLCSSTSCAKTSGEQVSSE